MPFAGNHIPARVCDQSVNVPKNMTAVCVKFSDDFHKEISQPEPTLRSEFIFVCDGSPRTSFKV